ncbi:hypothetical protein U6A24_10010 [Aquimarina gracilis]|uniref:Uncharacterized protein n=1 Tax=Aquimarina gracilis TaxID=874422 RepID=A0ABU5ZVG9_9FLAO|nr:hypothetical protein [Aquimarina gracilis]MEB3345797.1 hypothetical protein [Aquimarina gracilis]
METMTKKEQNVKLIEGTFTPSEAADILISMISKKINFHKLQRLSALEQYCDDNTLHLDDRIEQLKKAEEDVKSLIVLARNQGNKFKIKGTVEIELIK